jgi:hypothetical protein
MAISPTAAFDDREHAEDVDVEENDDDLDDDVGEWDHVLGGLHSPPTVTSSRSNTATPTQSTSTTPTNEPTVPLALRHPLDVRLMEQLVAMCAAHGDMARVQRALAVRSRTQHVSCSTNGNAMLTACLAAGNEAAAEQILTSMTPDAYTLNIYLTHLVRSLDSVIALHNLDGHVERVPVSPSTTVSDLSARPARPATVLLSPSSLAVPAADSVLLAPVTGSGGDWAHQVHPWPTGLAHALPVVPGLAMVPQSATSGISGSRRPVSASTASGSRTFSTAAIDRLAPTPTETSVSASGDVASVLPWPVAASCVALLPLFAVRRTREGIMSSSESVQTVGLPPITAALSEQVLFVWWMCLPER